MKNPILWAWNSLRERGAGRTTQVAISYMGNWWFDIQHGTNTARVVDISKLRIDSTNKQLGSEYRASKARPIKTLLKSLALPDNVTFVDFGCGRGKVLMVADQMKFQRIVGIEFSPDLCDDARQNIVRTIPNANHISILNIDAVDYRCRDDENVFYFYDPFGAEVLASVVDEIAKSVQRMPRPTWLVYYSPKHRRVIDERNDFELREHAVIEGADYLVYVNRSLSGEGHQAGGRKTFRIHQPHI